MSRLIVCAAAALAIVSPVFAQTPAPPAAGTPAACLAAAADYEREQTATRAQTGMTYAQIAAGKSAKARECLATLSPNQTLPSVLLDLVRLHVLAGDSTSAAATMQTYLSTVATNETQRADRYTAAIPVLIGMRTPTARATAEELALRLDSLSDAMNVRKVAGHGSLLRYYRAIDVDDKMDVHASRIIALAPSLSAADRQTMAGVLTLAYTALAAVYGDRAQAPQAIDLLTRGERDLSDIPDAAKQFAPVRERYALVGQPGAPIVAPYWVNAPDSTRYTPTGNVTLLEFSAHWCGPCRKSYPAIARLQQKYSAQGLQTVFATSLYGFFKDRQNLTAEQEVEANRDYYIKEHEFSIPVAIAPTDGATGLDPNSAAYKVSGIPHIVVLDRSGIIRMIVIGWDPTSEARLAAMLDTLVSQPPSQR